jgi:hypothetical protein
LKNGGFLVIVSTNHSKEELKEIFVSRGLLEVKDLTDVLSAAKLSGLIFQKPK